MHNWKSSINRTFCQTLRFYFYPSSAIMVKYVNIVGCIALIVVPKMHIKGVI